MNNGKTHFADDDTLAYIAELEEALKLLVYAVDPTNEPERLEHFFLWPVKRAREVLAKGEKK